MDGDEVLISSLSSQQLHDVDQRCDWFCAMLKTGQSPRPADFARGLDDKARDYLLDQLRLLEQELQEPFAATGTAPAPPPGSEFVSGVTVPAARGKTMAGVPSTTLDSAAPAAEGVTEERADREGPAADARSARRYRVLNTHAEGGLGAVFVAHDRQFNREVALKEIRAEHSASPDARQRFSREAEITGSLEHPGIVPVYSREEDDDGRPYYAMRFIRGESLRDAIRRFHEDHAAGGERQSRNMELRRLLTRFVAVCHTVQYAHTRGVLHRDLKPDNVMLGDYGETLIVDWGLAKRMAAEDGQPNAEGGGQEPGDGERETDDSASSSGPHPWETRTGQVLGTPTYMSPEQAAGKTDRLRPASDIYSLGATLYCLLTGAAPFPYEELSGTLARVCSGDFPRPRTIRPATPKPLEAICLKAMARNPANRYASASELADDVERYLGDEPVTAWREPLTIGARRWLQRHRTRVAVAGVLLLVAGAGLGSYVHRRTQAAGQAYTLLHEVDKAWQAASGGAPSPVHLWQFARQAAFLAENQPLAPPLRQQLMELAKDCRLLQRLDRAEMAKTELDVRQNTFNLLAALPEYHQAFLEYGIAPEQTTHDDAANLLAQRPPRVRLILMAVLDDWATLLRRQARSQAAVGHMSSLPAAAESQAGSSRHAAATRTWLEALADKVDPDPVRSQLRQAIRGEKTDALARLAQQAEMLEQPPRVLKLVGSVLFEAGRKEAAVDLLRRTQSKYPGDFWSNASLAEFLYKLSPPQYGEALRFDTCALAVRPDAVGVLLNSGNALFALGRYDEAADMFRRALELRQDYASAHCNLGTVLWQQGDADEAIGHYRRAIEMRPQYAEAHYNLGNVFHEQGQLDEASQEYRAAIKLKPDDANFVFNLGVNLQKQGRLADAIREYRRATELQPGDPGTRCRLAQALAIQGDVDEAIRQCRRVIEQDPCYAEAYCELGVALSRQGKLDEAIEQYRKAIEAKPDYVEAHGNLAIALQMQGKLREATEQYRKVLELQPDGALTYYNLGNLLKAQGQLDEAVAQYRRALELAPDYAEAHCNLAGALRDQGRFTESLAAYQRGHRLGSQRADWSYPSEQWVQRAEELAALENKLSAITVAEVCPENATERLRLASEICRPKQLYGTAVRLFQDAFAEDPRLADHAPHRYNAACCAALAADDMNHGREPLENAERSEMRRQAIRWLQAEVRRCTPAAASGNPKIRAEAIAQLRHWQADGDLAGIRDAGQLQVLPEDERTACERLWTEVNSLVRGEMKDSEWGK